MIDSHTINTDWYCIKKLIPTILKHKLVLGLKERVKFLIISPHHIWNHRGQALHFKVGWFYTILSYTLIIVASTATSSRFLHCIKFVRKFYKALTISEFTLHYTSSTCSVKLYDFLHSWEKFLVFTMHAFIFLLGW